MNPTIYSKYTVKPHMVTRLAERFGKDLPVRRQFRQKGNKNKYSRRALSEVIIRACKQGELVIQFKSKIAKSRWTILIQVIKVRLFLRTVYLIISARSDRKIINSCYTEEMVQQLIAKLLNGRKQRVLAVDYQSSDLWQKILDSDSEFTDNCDLDEGDSLADNYSDDC